MLKALKLLLPALLPSWRFFDVIAPSPRIQYCLFSDGTSKKWIEFNPRPANINFLQVSKRVFWNPDWNEALFLMSCAERLIEAPTAHSEHEIFKRLIIALQNRREFKPGKQLQFRLITIKREESAVITSVVFHSKIQRIDSINHRHEL